VAPRSIDPFLAVRFVSEYRGEPGRPFRQAMAAHFGVSDKTVKRELPRLVAAGLLEEETLPGRGAPKAYRVPEQVLVRANGFRRGLVDGGGQQARRRPVIDDLGPEFRRCFDMGIAAWCPSCGRGEPVLFPWAPDMDPVCPGGCAVPEPDPGERAWVSRRRGRDGAWVYEWADEGKRRWIPRRMETAYSMLGMERPEPPSASRPEPEPDRPAPRFRSFAGLAAAVSGDDEPEHGSREPGVPPVRGVPPR
jgi:hypothetical protein